MKKEKNNFKEQLERIKKLNKFINENYFEDQNGNDETSDYKADDEAENIFMEAMRRIKEIRGNDYSKDTYMKWVESYFFRTYGWEDTGPM